jgi:hypothetical protein
VLDPCLKIGLLLSWGRARGKEIQGGEVCGKWIFVKGDDAGVG